MIGPADETFVSVHQPLLGTVVEVRIVAPPAVAAQADSRIVDEIRRLEHVFSVFDDASELSRWRRGDIDDVSDELAALLRIALDWQTRSGGAFNPASGALSRVWIDGRDRDTEPDDAALRAVVDAIAAPAYAIVGGRPRRVGNCSNLTFNAIAKGFIVDAAAAIGLAVEGVETVVVNAGGDLLHRGTGSLAVGIENPLTPWDNAPPLTIVDIADGAVATSGSARRGLRIGGRWFSHVIDPRTGHPVDHIRSASVIAGDACTADAIATVVGVLPIDEGLAFVDALEGVSCCIVDDAGTVWRSERWSDHERAR